MPTPVKRGRGRPPGSKNKKTLAKLEANGPNPVKPVVTTPAANSARQMSPAEDIVWRIVHGGPEAPAIHNQGYPIKMPMMPAADPSPPAKKPKTAGGLYGEIQACVGKLQLLQKQQLVDVVRKLLGDGNLMPDVLEPIIPKPDLKPLFDEGDRLSRAIFKALPNSRYGSSTDHYGFKRCASANAACKRHIVEHAKEFKTAKQWDVLRDYCVGMLPVAEAMVEFDQPNDNKNRTLCIDTLKKFKAEADAKLPKAAAA